MFRILPFYISYGYDTYIAYLLVGADVTTLPVERICYSSLRRTLEDCSRQVFVYCSNRFVLVMQGQCVLYEMRAVFSAVEMEFQVWKVERSVQTFCNWKQWLA
jgi:hypothetical protein